MTALLLPIIFLLGSLGRRTCGGGLNQWVGGQFYTTRVMGDNPTRLFYGLTIGLAALVGGAPLLLAALMIPAVFLGTTTGNFNSLAMGSDGVHSYAHDFLGMSAHAALSAILPALLVWWFGGAWWWIAGFTMMASPIYTLAYAISGHSNYKASFPVGIRSGIEIAEVLWGGVIAVGAFLAF